MDTVSSAIIVQLIVKIQLIIDDRRSRIDSYSYVKKPKPKLLEYKAHLEASILRYEKTIQTLKELMTRK